jgi:hypothetical protein
MTPTNETKQTEKTEQAPNGLSTGSAHILTEQERAVMQALHARVVNARAQAWSTHVELTAAQAAFDGGLGFLANANGLGGGELTPDFAAIIKR